MGTPKHCPACGVVLESAAKRRSTAQHNRFFAICEATFTHWREDHEFRPRNAEHLRYYLEMKAGHFTVTKTARITSVDPDKLYALMMAFMKHSDDERLFLELDGNLLMQKKTLSIAYDKLGQAEFSKLKNAVCDVITIELGMDAEQLLRETESAA
jgi:hypothetical protein